MIPRDPNTIAAATLNFSGINLSYFEFNDGSPLYTQLNRNFRLIQEADFPEMKKWVGAKLDKSYKSHRYTVLFGDCLANKLPDLLPSESRFREDAKRNGNISEGYQATEAEEADLLKMDFAFYRAVVMTVYNYESLEEYQARHGKEGSAKLKTFLLDFSQLPRFQMGVKQRMVYNYCPTVDVLFLQEAGVVEWSHPRNFTVVKNHGSLIFYRTELFGAQDEAETKRWAVLLDINQDSAFVVTQNHFLLLSSHFKSSSPQFLDQEIQLIAALSQILKSYQHQQQFTVIVGADANHFVPDLAELNKMLSICPKSAEEVTTVKKRSYLQAQLNKADKAVREVKDHIMSTLPLEEYYVSLVDGTESQGDLLPSDRHPYDHYLVIAFLKKKNGSN